MKNLFRTGINLIIILLLTATVVSSQERKGAELTFTKQQEDVGRIATADIKPFELDIEFENSGSEPLVITTVRGCCGTRIKSYPKEPVMPGEKASVTIEFRLAPRAHRISRNISIMSNDPDGMKVFRILGEVVEESTEGAFGTHFNNTAAPRSN